MLQTPTQSPSVESPSAEAVSRNGACGAEDLSLREIYAGVALFGLASAMGSSDSRGNKTNIWKPEHVADKAVQLADEMVKRLARPQTR